MKIYKGGEVIKDTEVGKDKSLPIYNIPFFGPSISAKGVADKLGKERPPYMLERLTEDLKKELNFKNQKESSGY